MTMSHRASLLLDDARAVLLALSNAPTRRVRGTASIAVQASSAAPLARTSVRGSPKRGGTIFSYGFGTAK